MADERTVGVAVVVDDEDTALMMRWVQMEIADGRGLAPLGELGRDDVGRLMGRAGAQDCGSDGATRGCCAALCERRFVDRDGRRESQC